MYRIFTSLLILCSYNIHAQEPRITGNVKDNTGAPVVSATVSLLNTADSSWIQTELTGDKGEFLFNQLAAGKYLLDIQALGYAAKKILVAANENDIPLNLVLDNTGMLQQVTVTATKPFIENGPGKMVVNVGSVIHGTGSTAYDVLRKSPGVSIDEHGNISIQGKQGITVLINERPTYLSGPELVNYLRSLPSDDISQLELITQPSSRYDAEGSGGIINIVQKKNKKEGINGSLTIAAGMGIYPNTRNNGRLAWKKGKLNTYINASYMYATGFLRGYYERNILDSNKVLVTNVQGEVFMKEHFSDVLVRAGADYDINKNTMAGVLLSGNYHPNTELDVSKDQIKNIPSASTFYSHGVHEQGFLRKRLMANAYVKNRVSEKHSIVTNADYTYYFANARQLLDNKNLDLSGTELPGGLLVRSWTPLTTDAKSLKSDYTGELSKTTKLEVGIKSSNTLIDNDAAFDIYTPTGWVYDSARTNHFIYKENINAAYVSVNKQFGEKWKTQAGLRAENTSISGYQEVNGQSFERNFTSLFPTAYVSYAINKKNEIQLNYGRRILRPHYFWLNPFPNYESQYHYQTGNPQLKPEITYNLELTHVHNSKLTTRAWYTKTADVITTVAFSDDKPNTTYRKRINVSEAQNTGLSVSMYKKLLKLWELNVSGWGSYTEYYNADTRQRRSGTGTGIDIDSQFAFKNGWRAQTHINVTGPQPDGIYATQKASVYTTCGVSKKVLKDSGTVSLHIEDPLFTNRYNWTANTGNVVANGNAKYHTIYYGLSFVYNFGKETNARQRENVTEEARRM